MKNLGSVDRIIRAILGIILVVVGIIIQITMANFWWLSLIGGILLITSLISVCPLYLPFRLSTLKKK